MVSLPLEKPSEMKIQNSIRKKSASKQLAMQTPNKASKYYQTHKNDTGVGLHTRF